MSCLHIRSAVVLLALFAGCSKPSDPNSERGETTLPAQPTATESAPAPNNDTQTDVATVTAMNGRVAVTFPATPKHEQQTVEAKVGNVSFDSYKVQSDGVFWNLLITTYPPSVVAGSQDPMAFLQTRAEGNEKQKPSATRDTFKEIGESEYWAAEHRYTYPGGTNSEGGNYESGFALHRYYLVDTSVVSVFVDVADSVYKSRSQAIDDAIEQFFSSLTIRDE